MLIVCVICVLLLGMFIGWVVGLVMGVLVGHAIATIRWERSVAGGDG